MSYKETESCSYKCGMLPSCAPLAMGYVPMQQSAEPAFDADQALARGTLFPGLDLPFMNIVNKNLPKTPLHELMAIDFVCKELELYLDTHKEDEGAFTMLRSMRKLAKEGRKRYTSLYGPLTKADLLYAQSFTWLNNPWPWDYCEAEGKK